MEKVFELLVVPIVVTATLGFFSLPIVKPKIFFLVFKPVIRVIAVSGLGWMIFGIGHFTGMIRAEMLIADSNVSRKVSELLPDTFIWTFVPMAACIVFMLISWALVPLAQHQLHEEADKSGAKDDK